MTLASVLATLPAGSPYRPVCEALAAGAAGGALAQLRALPAAEADEAEGLALLAAAADPRTRDADDGDLLGDALVQRLWPSPRAAWLAPAREAYAGAGPRTRCALLALLGATGSRAAAEAFAGCIAAHSWPPVVYPRVSWELPRLAEHAAVLYPAVLFEAGGSAALFVDVGEAMLATLRAGRLPASALAADAGSLASALAANLDELRGLQQDAGSRWRFADDYAELRGLVSMLLELAGFLPADVAGEALRDALALADPRPAAFAAVSLLRRGAAVDDATLARLAADHETRGLVFELLDGVGLADRFPAPERSLARFAAADLAAWLTHPSELGRLPDELELAATLPVAGDQALCVWRFRDGDRWLAGVSGPYAAGSGDRPVRGGSTFSRFEPWESRTAEEHAAAVTQTLQRWQADRS